MHLEQGQVIFINDVEYVVHGMIAFREDTWEWADYMLKSSMGQCEWLTIEMEDEKPVYMLYQERYDLPGASGMQIMFDSETYEMAEKGKAIVSDYFGQVDVDKWESCKYIEYTNLAKDKFLSYEDWDGEVEKSFGTLLTPQQVRITEEKRTVSAFGYGGGGIGGSGYGSGIQYSGNVQNEIGKKRIGNIVWLWILLMFLAPMIINVLAGMKSNHIQSYLEDSGYFTYVTSVTNSSNHKKAKVYESTLTIEETVKMIINNVPEEIEMVSELAKEEGEEGDDSVGLSTRKEYAYVYLSEDGTTYIQVSNKKFLSSDSDAYRSRYRRHRYYRTYSMGSYGNTNTSYSSYLNSARQSSINSRTSSGGGTSFGK